MSVVRSMAILCDTCGEIFPPMDQVWVDGPIRSAAGREGWIYKEHKDTCSVCYLLSKGVTVSCPVPTP